MAPHALNCDLPSPTEEKSRPTVYVLDKIHPDAIVHCQNLFNTILPGDPEHSEWRQKAEYLLIRSSYFTAVDIDSAPKVKAIGKQGVGIDKIDSEGCAARGIKIFNTPGVNAQAVAETVLTLTMAVAREIGSISARQANGELVPKETCSGLLLNRKTIGIIGMGNVGERVARIFRGAFQADVIAYDPLLTKDAWAEIPHKRAETIEEVLRVADVLTLHVPLIPQTRDMIGYAQMKIMKQNAILINTARGGIVNETDLGHALMEGLIWGAGLDCHVEEPPSKDKYSKLWQQRVVSTPHIGAATSQTQMETAIAAIDRLYEYAISRKGA